MSAAASLDPDQPAHGGADCLFRDFRPELTFGYRIWHVSHAWQRCAEAALATFDLTHLQFVLLAKTAWLAREGLVPTQTLIARQAGVDRMMASKVLHLLEAKGFVARMPCPRDERAKRVNLTDCGRATLERAIPATLEAQAAFFGRLSPSGQRALCAELDRLLAFENIATPLAG